MLILLAAFLPFLVFGFVIWFVLFRAGASLIDLVRPSVVTS